MKTILAFAVAVVVIGSGTPAFAQGLHARLLARKAEAEKIKPVVGGIKLQTPKSAEEAYAALVNWANREDFVLDTDQTKEGIGQVVTVITQTKGGYKQEGTRLRFTVIKDDDGHSTVRIISEDLKRKKLFAAEAWGDGTVNEEDTKTVAEAIAKVLGVTPTETVAQK